MKKPYKTIAKKILEEAEKEQNSPEKEAPLKEWIAFALKRFNEMTNEEESKDIKEEYLINSLITELFFTFDERGLNKIIDSINSCEKREDRVHLNYDLNYEQAEILGKIIAGRFSKKSKDYLLKTLIETKNTKKSPLSPYRKPSLNKCPICDSTRFKKVQKHSLNEDLSKKVCLGCGYIHKITKKELESEFI